MSNSKTSLATMLIACAGICGSAYGGVRVIHASPDAPPVDVYVNGEPGMAMPNIAALAFTQGTGYVPLPSDTYRFRVTPAGAAAPVVIDATSPIDGSTDYTIAAINFLNSIQPLVLVDENTSDPSAARIRFVHASPDAPAVDIFAAGVAMPLFDAVSFGGVGNYLAVPGGTYDLDVRLDSNGTSVLSVPGVSVQNGFTYTIFAMGSVAGGTLQAVPFVDSVPAPGAASLLAVAGAFAARRRR